MKRFTLCIFVFLPVFAHGQIDMSANMYWQGYGNRQNQMYGAGGVNYLGRINDTIQHALAISEHFDFGNAGGGNPGECSAYVLNRYAGDTARIYEFPGHRVFPAHFNADKFVDFLCWSEDKRTITILLGTSQIDKFDTAVVLHDQTLEQLENEITVAELDSTGYDDALILDRLGNKAILFRGSSQFDSSPTIIAHEGVASQYLSIGNIRDQAHMYLCESRFEHETIRVLLYPLGSAFTFLQPSDSVNCIIDSTLYSGLSKGFATIDADGDGIDDIFLTGMDNNWKGIHDQNATLFVYKGGASINPLPTYLFHRPFGNGGSSFGTQMVDVGDVTGNGYHSLLVNEPDAFAGGGAIFLYNLGKARVDACTAYAEGPNSDNDCFGCYMSSLGDIDSNGRAEFATGYRAFHVADQLPLDAGGVIVFNGSAIYGPKVGIDDQFTVPNSGGIIRNYPNPFSQWTTIQFSSIESPGKNFGIAIFDALGREVETIYMERADGLLHSIVFDGSSLPAGLYVCRFSYGNTIITKSMIIVR